MSDFKPLGPPIRKPQEVQPKDDEQVSKHVWKRPDGTMYTKNMPPGNVPTPAKKQERDDFDWGGLCVKR